MLIIHMRSRWGSKKGGEAKIDFDFGSEEIAFSISSGGSETGITRDFLKPKFERPQPKFILSVKLVSSDATDRLNTNSPPNPKTFVRRADIDWGKSHRIHNVFELENFFRLFVYSCYGDNLLRTTSTHKKREPPVSFWNSRFRNSRSKGKRNSVALKTEFIWNDCVTSRVKLSQRAPRLI